MLVEILVAFGIVAVCVTLHVTVLLTLVELLFKKKHRLDRRVRFRYYTPLLLSIFSVIIMLHVVEACIWSAFYRLYNLFPDWESALYFSLVSYTTIGYGDLLLPENWRLLGAIEGISGVLLCGLSTAFIFAIINAIFRIRTEQFGGN